jgi:hypothetical protein
LAHRSHRELHAIQANLGSQFSKISELLSNDSEQAFKRDRDAFTRGGVLSPELLVTLLLYLVADAGRRGYHNVLDAFWDEARDHGIPLPRAKPVSAAAFCKARYKIQPALLRTLLHQAADQFDASHGHEHRWNGMRVFAVDGSWMTLQRSSDLWLRFGGPSDGHNPQMLVCTLFDVLAEVPVDVSIGPCHSSERDHLMDLLPRMYRGDLLVLDRGYPSYEVICELRRRGIHFVLRVPRSSTFKEVTRFVQDGAIDETIVLASTARAPSGLPDSIMLRAVCYVREDESELYLLTDLGSRHITAAKLDDLYHKRWQVEEFYKLEKGDYLGQGQFHAQYAVGVEQEVFAFALLAAISRTLMASAARTSDTPYSELSQKSSLLAVCSYLSRLALAHHGPHALEFIAALLNRIGRTRIPKRPGRSFNRRSYRPRPRWGPNGKIG